MDRRSSKAREPIAGVRRRVDVLGIERGGVTGPFFEVFSGGITGNHHFFRLSLFVS